MPYQVTPRFLVLSCGVISEVELRGLCQLVAHFRRQYNLRWSFLQTCVFARHVVEFLALPTQRSLCRVSVCGPHTAVIAANGKLHYMGYAGFRVAIPSEFIHVRSVAVGWAHMVAVTELSLIHI